MGGVVKTAPERWWWFSTEIVLETIEFPSLPDLITKGAWKDVKAVMSAHEAVALSTGGTPCFLAGEGQITEEGQSIASMIAAKVATGTQERSQRIQAFV